jgi:hypothetical protein
LRRILLRIGLGAALTMAPLALATMQSAHAVGPMGCSAQTNNGVLAAGTLTDGSPAAPSGGAPTSTCSYVEPAGSVGGGWVGGDSVSWKVTTTINVANDNTNQPCGFTSNNTTPPTYSASGSGPAKGGLGCLAGGATVTVAIG